MKPWTSVIFLGLSVSTFAGRLRRAERGLAEWESLSRANGKPGCPVDYDVPTEDGKPSPLHVASVNNFIDDVDSWWTEHRVREFEAQEQRIDDVAASVNSTLTAAQEGGASYQISPSAVQGCGMFATRRIAKGEKIGVVWVRGTDPKATVHFSPWFGRAINHCPGDQSTTRLELQPDNSVWCVAKRDIDSGGEITGDYNEAHRSFPHLVQGANPSWHC